MTEGQDRRAVRARAGGRCEHVDGRTVDRCPTPGGYVDFIAPRNPAYSNDLANHRLLCDRHHQLKIAAEALTVRRSPRKPSDG